MQKSVISEPTVHSLLLSRGVDLSNMSVEEIRVFWEPCISDLHDPFLLVGMESAVERILLARERQERVVIFGDYDVDGVSSTAMLMRFFTNIGIATSYRIPHRSHDGYGMKPYFFDDLSLKRVGLVITVDCGTRDIEAITYAKSLGIDVIVTDHHAVPQVIPKEAVAILSTKVLGNTYPFNSLAGSGTAFKLLHAAATRIYPTPELDDILMSYIDFAMLGTVADMMPLIGENRSIVKLGLEQTKRSRSPGLRRMMNGKNAANADSIGFYVGPRINAAGRIDHADTALKVLIGSDTQVGALIDELENLNTQRKGSTAYFVEQALETADSTQLGVIYRSDMIDHGVIGLVAGRLAERLGKPAIACLQGVRKSQKPGSDSVVDTPSLESAYPGVQVDTQGPLFDQSTYLNEKIFVFGSARSGLNYNLTAGLDRIAAIDGTIFVAYGGHAQAAGFTIYPEAFARFVDLWMADIAAHTLPSHSTGIGDAYALHSHSLLNKPWVSDALLILDEVTLDFVRALERIGPFGIGFAKPVFTLLLDRLPMIEALGGSGEHVRLAAPKGVKINGFGLGKYSQKLSEMRNVPVELLVEIDREIWQGRESVVISVRDIRKKM